MKATFIRSAEEIEAEWPHLEKLFSQVAETAAHGEFDANDLRQLAIDGRLTLGFCSDYSMAIAFEFRHYPKFVAVNVVALAGHGLSAVAGQFFDAFKAFCRSAGADCIEASCSGAMARLLRTYGFIEIYKQVRSDL
ncbi:hypothetical protein [Pusillimonas minor]|uniref:GNAT family N-acetyltransferase n=1 Tax=Pusillimonas minor TaxID=2697024 RepID=A0A842HIT4_9BURK|nr:hypothetical protein [Pusillimonas minor]MBC2768559.1 hypothetical protein [Pusillimonas minor]